MLHAPRSHVVVYLGPARSGKTQELVRQYVAALQSRPLPPVEESGPRDAPATLHRNLWLAPNSRAADQVRSHLLASGLQACLSPGVMTFQDLTRLILADAKSRLRPLRPAVERELLRRVVDQALKKSELEYFAEAARRSAFIDLLADHVHELKRSDICPAAYAKAPPPRTSAEQHRELALLYNEYERTLSAHALIDEDGSHRAARDLLAADKSSAFQKLHLVVADGFTDFTRTQHAMLRLLAARSEMVLISLPNNAPAETPRSDLFAKTAATLHELKHHHPHLEIRELDSRPLSWPALDHVLQHVFRNPNRVPAPSAAAIDSLGRLRVIAGASTHDEIVQIARRIKEQLTTPPLPCREGPGEGSKTRRESIRPGDIVVAFRSLADVAPRVREVFDQFGIPYSLDSNLPLATAPALKTLVNLLRLDDENWPFRGLVSVITNNMLTAFDGPPRQSAEWLTRELQIAEGREKILSRVEELAKIETPLEQLSDHVATRVTAARTALPLFQQLAQSLNNMSLDATPTEWCAALAQLASQLGVELSDSVAWRALESHFASLERLDALLGSPPRKLSRRELISTFIDVASHESLPRAHDDVGRVRVVAAPAVRAISAKHLYLAGMSEQSFPAPERAGKLATDADYRFLARAADQRGLYPFAESAEQKGTVPLPPGPTRSHDEMLLFYEVLSRAEESLTISYPALDDKAQELPPSPYVLEIQRAFGDGQKHRLQPDPPQLSPVPCRRVSPKLESSRLGETRLQYGTYSMADWRIQAVARAIETDHPDRRPLAGIISSAACGLAINSALRIIHDRARGESFGPAEGLLTSPAVAARLAARFGSDHYWSPSQWETYAACPYKFFLKDVLKFAPLGDLVLETDYTRRGSRLHNVLAAFHRQWPELRGDGPMAADEEQAHFFDQLSRVIDEQIASAAEGGIDAALLELDRRQIRKWAKKHFEHHVKYDGACSKRGVAMKPTHLEFRFGPSRVGDDDRDPDSINQAFVLDVNGERIRVTGQIDRIDVGTIDGKTVFSVIDYKSGRRPALSNEEIESGERLQLPLYVEAAQALLFDGGATPLVAGYWSMTAGFDAKGALAVEVEGDAAERWKRVRGTIEQRVAQFVNDIRHGAFPVASRDDQCTSYCDFNTVCRIAQVRSLNKTVSPPAACGLANPNKPNPGDP